jgi:hypothetical protein
MTQLTPAQRAALEWLMTNGGWAATNESDRGITLHQLFVMGLADNCMSIGMPYLSAWHITPAGAKALEEPV